MGLYMEACHAACHHATSRLQFSAFHPLKQFTVTGVLMDAGGVRYRINGVRAQYFLRGNRENEWLLLMGRRLLWER